MTRQTNILACNPEELYLALAHIENKLARAWLRNFDGRKAIPIDSIAMLSEHHVSDNDDGYATHFRSIFTDPLGSRDLAATGAQGLPNIVIAMLLARSPGLQNYPCWTKFSDQRSAQTLHP
jgi:hypothetical protein